jgi:hypothetical protein
VREVLDFVLVPVFLPVKFESATRDSGPIPRSLSYFSLNKCGKVLIFHQNLPFFPSLSCVFGKDWPFDLFLLSQISQ